MRSFFGFCVVFFSACVLSVSMFVPVSLSSQPPIDTTTLYEGTIGWGPFDADPGIAYDEASQELIFNSYEGLIAYSGELYYEFDPLLATNVPGPVGHTMTVTNTSAVGTDPVGSTWTDGSTAYTLVFFVDEKLDGFHAVDVIWMTDGTTWRTWQVDSMSGTSTITLGLFRASYTFNIRTTPDIYFYNNLGEKVGKLTLEDCIYTFQRYQVMCNIVGVSPLWMYDKSFYDLPDHTLFDNSTAMMLAHIINDSIVGDPVANTFTLNIGTHFPDNAFKQILANTWGVVGSKNNTIAMGSGSWDGDLFSTAKYGGPQPDWWIDWANQGPGLGDTYWSDAFPSNDLLPERYIGTGPYHISTIDDVELKVIMEKNPDYWRGWPAPGSSGSLDTIEVDYIASWDTRKAQFLAGAIDTCAVPRANMSELLDNVTKQPVQPEIKTIKNLVSLSESVVSFTFTINPTSAWIGTGHFPDGIPTDFFNNTHTRRAFAYAFNHTQYITQALLEEAPWRETPLIQGLFPDYHTTVKGYDANYSASEAELKQAMYNGVSVWDSGFTLTLIFYPLYNNQVRILWQGFKDFFDNLSIYDGRTGAPFKINVRGTGISSFPIDYRNYPMWVYWWLADYYHTTVKGYDADYADADNFVRPYMHSSGYYAYLQNYTADNGWGSQKDGLIDAAIHTLDGPQRASLYADLEQIYVDDCPSIPLAQPLARMWMKYWVKGWYYGALYPSGYFRNIWKQDTPWYDISGSTAGTSDNVVAMKDIAYLIAHFNAKAPDPTRPLDPKWVGVYGANGCVDPYGDRTCNMKDIAGAIANFNAHGPGHP